MRIKLDENIPASLADHLSGLGHDVDTVMTEGLTGRTDLDVWAGAQASARLLITQDLDFSDVRRFAPGTHYGILLVRLAQPGRSAVTNRVVSLFADLDASSWERCFVVATDCKVRIRRPTSS